MECMLTPLCCFAVTTPSSSQSLNIVLLFGGLLPLASSYLQHLDSQIHAVSRLCHDQILKPLNHCRCIAGMCMLYKIHSNPKCCLYSELPPACQRVRHTRAAAMAGGSSLWAWGPEVSGIPIWKMFSACTCSHVESSPSLRPLCLTLVRSMVLRE